MKFLFLNKAHSWKSLIDSFKPLPVPRIVARRVSHSRDALFTSPHVTRVPSMSISAEGNTSLFTGCVTTEEGMQRSLDMAERYAF